MCYFGIWKHNPGDKEIINGTSHAILTFGSMKKPDSAFVLQCG